MTELTSAGSSQCTVAQALNNCGQVVGSTCDEQDAFLWTGGK
jgi:hypothetical protein